MDEVSQFSSSIKIGYNKKHYNLSKSQKIRDVETQPPADALFFSKDVGASGAEFRKAHQAPAHCRRQCYRFSTLRKFNLRHECGKYIRWRAYSSRQDDAPLGI
jgi:hypothetical protein